MQTPKFPYDLSRFAFTQRFNTISPLTGKKHEADDIIPLYRRFDGLPADCYPVFSGQTLKMHDADPIYGKGIRVRTRIWPDLNRWLKNFKAQGTNLDILYWHLLDVTDEDGWINQNTPVGITGNTGLVFSNGEPVPDHLKGKPPYPGLHLHLEVEVDGKKIDPEIIYNYKPMSQIKTQKKGEELRLVLAAATWDEWVALCKVYGLDPNDINEKFPV